MSGQDPKRNKGRTDDSNVNEGSALVAGSDGYGYLYMVPDRALWVSYSGHPCTASPLPRTRNSKRDGVNGEMVTLSAAMGTFTPSCRYRFLDQVQATLDE